VNCILKVFWIGQIRGKGSGIKWLGRAPFSHLWKEKTVKGDHYAHLRTNEKNIKSFAY
jgi:hypothetical protein